MRALALLLALLLTAGCLSSDEGTPDAAPPDERTDAASLRPVVQQFTGTATGTPAQPQVQDFPFQVPSGAIGVNGTLTYETPTSAIPTQRAEPLRLELLDPDGNVVETGYRDAEGRLVVATVDPPKPGEWTYRVTAVLAANLPFTLEAVAELIVPENNVDRRTMTLGARSFYEINLILEKDASFNFTFNATGPIEWDVHSHPGGEVKYWERGTGEAGGATFTAPERGVYSVLFENAGATDVTLQYEVVGKFRLHSHAG